MIGKDLGDPLAAPGLLHPFPESHRLVGVVAGEGHQKQANMIGLGFLAALERFAPDSAKHAMIHFIPGDSLARMMSKRVRDFMRKNSRNLVIVLHDSEQAAKNHHLAARKAKGVDVVLVKDIDPPFVEIAFSQVHLALQRLDFRGMNDRLGDAADALAFGSIGGN